MPYRHRCYGIFFSGIENDMNKTFSIWPYPANLQFCPVIGHAIGLNI